MSYWYDYYIDLTSNICQRGSCTEAKTNKQKLTKNDKTWQNVSCLCMGDSTYTRFFCAQVLTVNGCEFLSRISEEHDGWTLGDKGQPLLMNWRSDCLLLSVTLYCLVSFPVAAVWTAVRTITITEHQNLFEVCSESELKPSFSVTVQRLMSISCCFCLQSCHQTFWHDRGSCSFGEQVQLWPTLGQQALYYTSKYETPSISYYLFSVKMLFLWCLKKKKFLTIALLAAGYWRGVNAKHEDLYICIK